MEARKSCEKSQLQLTRRLLWLRKVLYHSTLSIAPLASAMGGCGHRSKGCDTAGGELPPGVLAPILPTAAAGLGLVSSEEQCHAALRVLRASFPRLLHRFLAPVLPNQENFSNS